MVKLEQLLENKILIGKKDMKVIDLFNFFRKKIGKNSKSIKAIQGEIPKFVICFMVKNGFPVPHYKIEGESETWIELPHNNGTYYDPVEDYDEYQRNIEFIDQIVKEELGEFYGSFGSCHLAWEIQKRLLMECYGIEWHSPSELNPHIDFD